MMTVKRKIKVAGTIVLCFLFIVILGIVFQKNNERSPVKVIFIAKVLDNTNEFWSALVAGANMAAQEYGVELTVMGPKEETDIAGQNRMIDEAIAKKPDVIVLTPDSFKETTPYARKIEAAGIHLVLVDSVIDADFADSEVATNNFEAGAKLGNYMRLFTDKESQIAFVGNVQGTSTAIEREEGIRFGLKEYDAQVKEVVFCGSEFQTAYDLTMEILEEQPDITVIVGFNEYSAVGVARAVKDKGVGNRVAVFGIDSSIEQVKLLEEGIFKGLVIQNPFNMGYLGVEQAVKIADGKENIRKLDSGSTLVTKQDMYSKENQKLLFPFIGRQAVEEEIIVSK